MDKLTAIVLKDIREKDMLPAGATVMVGFSGGADSVCLLSVLYELRALLKIRLLAVHVNHGLRGAEADRDEAFSEAFCRERGIEFRSVHIDVNAYVREHGTSVEESARILRYRAFDEIRLEMLKAPAETEMAGGIGGEAGQAVVSAYGAYGTENVSKGGNEGKGISCTEVRIATAHHADDQTETILMNMFRGSGLKGLGGIRPVRGEIIRPLLGVSKADILKYVERNGLQYVTDSTNLINDYTRNCIRNELMPVIRTKVNERAAEHVALCGEVCAEADMYFTEEAKTFADSFMRSGEENGRKYIILCQKELKQRAKIIRRYVIIEALGRIGVGLKDWGERHFKDIDDALFGNSGYHVDLPGRVYAENTYRETTIWRPL